MPFVEPMVLGGRTVIVLGNSMLPLYRHGDRLIVSDKIPLVTGDRVLVESREFGTMGGMLLRRDSKCICLTLGGRSHLEVQLDPRLVEYIGRIVWASQ